jgi:organic radical activating enzyme
MQNLKKKEHKGVLVKKKSIPLEEISNLKTMSEKDMDYLEEYDLFERGGGNNTILVDWVLGNTCDYSCTYCTPDNYDGSAPWPTLEVFKNVVKTVTDYYNYRNKIVRWNLLGGEVTVWKEFDKALEIINNVGTLKNTVSIQSNGSRTVRWWKKNAHLMSEVLFSYHPEQADYKHMTKVANALYDAGVYNTFLMVCFYPKLEELCFEAGEYFLKNLRCAGHVAMKPLQKTLGTAETFVYEEHVKKRMQEMERFILPGGLPDRPGDINLTPSVMYWTNTTTGKRVMADANELAHERRNHWKGWDCNIGIEKINITNDGWFISGSYCGQVRRNFGHITRPEAIKFPTKSVTCKWDWCPCVFDVSITKSKKRIRWIRNE